MDPWFENLKILLTYWLMSSNRDTAQGLGSFNMADLRASPPLSMSASTAVQQYSMATMQNHPQAMSMMSMMAGQPHQMPHPPPSMHLGQISPQTRLPTRLPGNFGMPQGSQGLTSPTVISGLTGHLTGR